MKITFKRLNHVQICIPKGAEADARKFYCDLLDLEEIEKPKDLKKNGGFWLKIADIELHGFTDFHFTTLSIIELNYWKRKSEWNSL